MTVELTRYLPVGPDMYPDNPILAVKLATPKAPPFWVARPDLAARVAAGAHGPVTLVTGPAGSGKTQLVASWAASRTSTEPVAWVTLDSEDGQASIFWTYLLEALRRAEPAFPEFPPLVPSETVDRAMLGRIAAALCALSRPVVLVLDGVTQMTGQQWTNGLEFVLRHSDRRLRLVLIGRWDPPMPLYQYRLAGGLSEIRSADLAFTADEAVDLLALHDVALGEEALRSLLEHTEGWAAGLRLCASALQGRAEPDQVVATISGGDRTIAEYFVGEVLRLQAPEVRSFLLETSVLDTFTPELAEAVTGRPDARRMLAMLTRTNAFVHSPAGTGRYRYHRLFGELLLAQLTCEEPDRLPQLHLRAAAWLAERGEVVEAASHAARSGWWTETAALIVADCAVGNLVIDGTRGRLGAILRELPDWAESAEVAIVRAALAIADGKADLAADQLALVDALLGGDLVGCADTLRLAVLLLEVHPLLAGEPAAVADAIREAETLLAVAPAERSARHPELHVLLLAAKGVVQSRTGAVDAAAATFSGAVAAAGTGCEPVKIECLGRLALIEAFRGRLTRADTLARQAIELAERHGLEPGRRPVAGLLALAWAEVERYDVEAADRHLRAAQPQCGRGRDGTAVAAYAIVRSRRLQARGELRGAMKALRDVEAADPAAPVWLARENALGQARMLIAAGHLTEADAVLQRLVDPDAADAAVVRAALLLAGGEPDRADRLARSIADGCRATAPVLVDAWLLLAMRAAAANDVDGARESLRRALRAAGPEALRRVLHHAWTQLRRVLREDEDLIAQYQALGTHAESSPGAVEPRDTDPAMVESLSPRELEVLRGMAAMLPTEEIAASMFVSINTVKTHVRSILRKLSASRRNEAVRRARSLDLL
jgi:LuxR family transcriptional regulator, maltose regulon positive regulatory protein